MNDIIIQSTISIKTGCSFDVYKKQFLATNQTLINKLRHICLQRIKHIKVDRWLVGAPLTADPIKIQNRLKITIKGSGVIGWLDHNLL